MAMDVDEFRLTNAEVREAEEHLRFIMTALWMLSRSEMVSEPVRQVLASASNYMDIHTDAEEIAEVYANRRPYIYTDVLSGETVSIPYDLFDACWDRTGTHLNHVTAIKKLRSHSGCSLNLARSAVLVWENTEHAERSQQRASEGRNNE